MKKFIYLLMILAIGLVSCENSLEDVYDDLSDNIKPISGDIELILTDEDYTDDVEDGGLGLRFPNFNSEDQAKELVPSLLDDRYPALKNESSALVTYALYAPQRRERSLIVYEVTDEDYDALELRFPNFSRDSHIEDFLEFKYPSPEDRTLLSLTYDYFSNGSVNELNNGFLFINGSWKNIIGFTNQEYALMGESFPNFSNEDEASEKIAIILKDKLKFGGYKAGDIVGTMYKLFVTDEDDVDGDGRIDDRTTYSYVKYFISDGTNWSEYNDVITQQLQFGHDGTKWVPDNTIKYTINDADVTLISNALIDVAGFEGPADNVAFFGSFDRRSGSGNFWDEDMLLRAFNILLDARDPSAEEGQKYFLTFVVYTGSTGTESKSLIKKDGVWVYQ